MTIIYWWTLVSFVIWKLLLKDPSLRHCKKMFTESLPKFIPTTFSVGHLRSTSQNHYFGILPNCQIALQWIGGARPKPLEKYFLWQLWLSLSSWSLPSYHHYDDDDDDDDVDGDDDDDEEGRQQRGNFSGQQSRKFQPGVSTRLPPTHCHRHHCHHCHHHCRHYHRHYHHSF